MRLYVLYKAVVLLLLPGVLFSAGHHHMMSAGAGGVVIVAASARKRAFVQQLRAVLESVPLMHKKSRKQECDRLSGLLAAPGYIFTKKDVQEVGCEQECYDTCYVTSYAGVKVFIFLCIVGTALLVLYHSKDISFSLCIVCAAAGVLAAFGAGLAIHQGAIDRDKMSASRKGRDELVPVHKKVLILLATKHLFQACFTDFSGACSLEKESTMFFLDLIGHQKRRVLLSAHEDAFFGAFSDLELVIKHFFSLRGSAAFFTDLADNRGLKQLIVSDTVLQRNWLPFCCSENDCDPRGLVSQLARVLREKLTRMTHGDRLGSPYAALLQSTLREMQAWEGVLCETPPG